VSKLWLSSPKMTVFVEVSQYGTILAASPIIRKFIGQPYTNLTRWLKPDRIEYLNDASAG
jgi:hypothetical protein